MCGCGARDESRIHGLPLRPGGEQLDQASDFAIHTVGLRKVFGKKVAVGNLSLTVRRGEVFGFLGPNGAGKSTSIKMLLGLVKPSSGQAFVLGAPSDNVEIRRKIGFLPEDFRFYTWLSATELLRLHGRLCGMTAERLRERVPALLELVGLTAHREKRLRDFSKGMLQRIGLAQALIHEPEVVFLDEPTSGLDPMGRRLVRDVIRGERERGATIFLNSHILSEIEITCDRVVFIKEGQVIASHDLRAHPEGQTRLAARVRNLSAEAVAGLSQWGSAARLEGERLTLIPFSTNALPEILRHLVASGSDVFEFRPEHVSLEDLFLKVLGEDRGL